MTKAEISKLTQIAEAQLAQTGPTLSAAYAAVLLGLSLVEGRNHTLDFPLVGPFGVDCPTTIQIGDVAARAIEAEWPPRSLRWP